MEQLTYNYYCLNHECKLTKIIHITKDIDKEDRVEYCVECKEELKQVGIHTSIVHVNTQESKI